VGIENIRFRAESCNYG